MKKIATHVKDLTGFRGTAALYRLSEPMHDYDDAPVEYVVVSAADVPCSGPETYIFPANADGEITSWKELEGSFRGGLDHKEALAGAGYTTGDQP